MSLINDALKKAQRQRADDAADKIAAGTLGGTTTRREQSPSKQALLLIAGGASVLVVLSVLVTIYLLRPDDHSADAAPTLADAAIIAPVSEPQKTEPDNTPSPVISMPVITTAPPQVEATAVKPAPSAAPAPMPEVIETTPPEPAPIEPVIVDHKDEIYQFLAQTQITGIRAAGSDSKVLMNGQVYRLNDLVNRELALRLIKVDSTSLIFVDANGVQYTKNL